MSKLSIIEGIGEAYQAKFEGLHIRSTEAFLKACAKRKGRLEVAEKSGVSDKLILKWANAADLLRIKGVGGEYAELLEAAGVDTVVELAGRKPANLLEKMGAVNAEKHLVRRLPALKLVEDWVEQAKKLPRVLEY